MKDNRLNQNSGKFMQMQPTVQSDAFGTTGTTTVAGVATGAVLGSVTVPIGAYVTKVQLMATVAVGTQSLDVGDSDDSDRYIDGLASLTQYNIVTAPNVSTSTTSAGEVAGRYYAASDTIDVTSTITASADVSVGSCILSVWYYV